MADRRGGAPRGHTAGPPARHLRRPRGSAFVNAAAELPDTTHPGREVVAAQKRRLLGYLRALCEDAAAPDPDALAGELLLLHEGATVLGGLGVTPRPAADARRLASLALERVGL